MKLRTQMVAFFGAANCTACEAIQKAVKDLCVAHGAVVMPENGTPHESVSDAAGRVVLVGNDKVVRGNKNIMPVCSAHVIVTKGVRSN